MNAEANKALIARIFEGINRGEFAPLDPHPGFHETRQYVPPMHKLFADWHTTHMQQIAEGELVCSYAAIELTQVGPFAGVEPTGKRIALEVLSLDEVRDGIVVEHNSASSWADVLRQLEAPAFRAWPARRPYTLVSQQSGPADAGRQQAKALALKLLADLSRGEYAAAYDSPSLNDLVDRFVELRRAFPDVQFTPVVQIAEGDLVATRATLLGTHLGSLYGVPATSRTISWDFFCLARIEHDVLVEQQSMFDWNAVLAQLGLLAM